MIPGRFPGLNEFIDANRRKRGKYSPGNLMKQRDQTIIRQYLPNTKYKRVFIEFTFFEYDRKRDPDNICGYFHKIFMDALVQAGILENDGWRNIKGMADYFKVDKKYPRIEVEIREV